MMYVIRAWMRELRERVECWAADRVTDAFADLDAD